jgi:hypothetical protein
VAEKRPGSVNTDELEWELSAANLLPDVQKVPLMAPIL